MSDLSRWCVSGPLKGHMAEALGRAGSEKTWEKRKRQESLFFLNDCNFGSLTKQRKNRTSRGSRYIYIFWNFHPENWGRFPF